MKNKLTKYGMMIVAIVLLVALAFAGAGAAADKHIYTAQQWQANVTSGGFSAMGSGDTIYLEDNIDFGGATSDVVITFNDPSPNIEGQGHTISNFDISGSLSFGVFGLFAEYYGNRIANLTLSNFSVTGTGAMDSVGGLVGYAENDIHFENVHVEYGNLSGSDSVGGLIGYAESACYINESSAERMYVQLSSGNSGAGGLVGFTGYAGFPIYINDSWVNVSEIDAAGLNYAGGLVGYADAESYMNNASVMDCKITGNTGVGGLIGHADVNSEYDASRVESCTITGSDGVGGLAGQATPNSNFGSGISYVNATWVSGSSNVGALLGNGIENKIPADATNPLHNNVWGSNTTATTSSYGNGFDESSKSLSDAISAGYCSVIDKTPLTTGVEYGYGSARHIAYDANGATGTVPANQTYAYNSTITVAGKGDLVKTGYEFNGWTVGSTTGTLKKAGETFTITADTTLYANWTLPTYVEVNTWAGLNKSVSEWTDTTTARTVAVNASILDRVTGNNTYGIDVKGKIILTTTNPLISGGNEAVIDGNGIGRLFIVASTGNLTLIGNGTNLLKLTDGIFSTHESGAGIYVNGGALHLNEGAMLTNCSTVFTGGGVYVNPNGIFTMNRSSIINCSAGSNLGGGIYVEGTGMFTMIRSTITGCNANSGGGVYVETDGMFTMNNSTITKCNSTSIAGGVENAGSFIMIDSSISDCTDAGGYSGGLVNAGTFMMKNGSFDGNRAAMVGEILTTESVNINGTAKIGKNGFGLFNTGYYSNITTNGGFSGNIANITLWIENQSTSAYEEKPSAWIGQVIVKNGSSIKDKFTLSSAYSGYKLSASGNDLVLTEYQNPYVEVSTWAGLNKSVSEWTDTTEARVVAVSANITDRVAGNETDGIAVKGKVILTTTASPAGGNEAVVNGNGIGRLFNVASTGNLTLVGNGSSVLNLTGGKLTGSAEVGAGIIIDGGNLTLNTGAMITNSSARYNGGGIYIKKGTFIMNGGCISECKSTSLGADGGGAVFINYNAVFEMNGGTIMNCSARTEGGGIFNRNIFAMTGGTITYCSAQIGGGIISESSISLTDSSTISGNTAIIGAEIYTASTITLCGNAKIGGNDIGLFKYLSYPNITASSFTGSVANITLCSYSTTIEENPSAWLGQVIVKNGASVKDKFALSSAYSGYQLLASGNDLILAKIMPTGSLFVNISNANNNPVTLALNSTSGSNINTTTLAAGVTNITFSNLDDGSYSFYGSYVNGTATTAVTKLVTLSGGAGYVDLVFPQQNVSSVVNTSAESGASTPKVTVEGLDTLAAGAPAPAADKGTVFSFNAVGEVYNGSNTNQKELRNKIIANNSNAEITFLNFTVTESTVNLTTGDPESVAVIADPTTLLTIYMAYDMTNRQNIQVWRYHNGTAEQLQELTSGNPSDGKYKLDGTKGIFIYSQHFSSYTISSTTTSTPVTPSSGGSSSSHHSGSSQLAKSPTVTPTAEPTVVPTQAQSTVIPTQSATSATTQPTQGSPAPLAGIIAGIGAAAVVLAKLRK